MGKKILEITVRIGCKNMCSYCPQDTLIKAYKDLKKVMSFEDFKSIMRNVPQEVQIDFSGFAEPFLNKEASLMMKYCIEHNYRTIIYTTLEGFTEEDAKILRGVTFGNIAFHRYKGFGYNEEKFNKSMELFKRSNIKSTGNYNDGNVGNIQSRAGNLYEVQDKLNPIICSAAPEFNHNIVLPNGDVYLCCMDYGLKQKIGNLLETSYDNLDRNSVNILANKYNSDLICRKCELATLKYPKNW